jgi:hypothetical protein
LATALAAGLTKVFLRVAFTFSATNLTGLAEDFLAGATLVLAWVDTITSPRSQSRDGRRAAAAVMTLL